MTNNILDVLTFMFDFLFESAEQDSSQELDDDLLKKAKKILKQANAIKKKGSIKCCIYNGKPHII